MDKELNESKVVITLDGSIVSLEQLDEARKNKAVRIIEDKNTPGCYRTLKRMVE